VTDQEKRASGELPRLPGTSRRSRRSPERASSWNLANYLTALRVLLIPVFFALLMWDWGQNEAVRWAAAVAFVLAMVTDFIDGWLARAYELVTPFGKMVDPIADKLLVGSALVGLSAIWVETDGADGLVPWVTVVILFREIGVTVVRFMVIRHGVIPANRGGKIKTLLQSIAIVMYVLPLDGFLRSLSWWLMLATVVVTVLTGLDYVQQAVTMRRTSERAQAKQAGQPDGPPSAGPGTQA
jgi:CDP-diacylglycerol--glycerol-3-phosphate 3-phosphatidyltransferase